MTNEQTGNLMDFVKRTLLDAEPDASPEATAVAVVAQLQSRYLIVELPSVEEDATTQVFQSTKGSVQ